MSTTSKDFKVKNGLEVAEGGVFGGTVTVSTPTENSHAATKEYVDNSAGGSSLTVSENPPESPSVGDQWYNSGDGVTYVFYDNFWVESSSGGQEMSLSAVNSRIDDLQISTIMGAY